jgi:hypothetical protein
MALPTQPALLVDAFRILAGVLLAFYHVDRVRSAAAVGLAAPRACRALSFALSVFVALGLAPRACAVLLLSVAAATQASHAVAPLGEEAFARSLAFWVAMLPVGRTLAVVDTRGWRTWSGKRVSGWTVACCIAFFFVSYLDVAERAPVASSARNGLLAAMACAVTPLGLWRGLAALPLASSLWAMGYWNCVSLSGRASILVCAFLVAAVSLGGASPRDFGRASVLDFPAAVGGCVVLVLALHVLATLAEAPSVSRSTAAALASMGLPCSSGRTFEVHAAPSFGDASAVDGAARVHATDMEPHRQKRQATSW